MTLSGYDNKPLGRKPCFASACLARCAPKRRERLRPPICVWWRRACGRRPGTIRAFVSPNSGTGRESPTASEEVHRCDTKIVKLTEEELRRFVLDCALIGEIHANAYDTRKPLKLLETAKRLRDQHGRGS